jgi:type IV pilus assembly protein PilM
VTDSTKTPWYKKELSLKRDSAKKDAPKTEAPAAAAPSAGAEADPPKTRWYKKELSLKRAPKAEAPAPEQVDAEPVAPAAVPAPEPEPAPLPEPTAGPTQPQFILPTADLDAVVVPPAPTRQISWVEAVLASEPVAPAPAAPEQAPPAAPVQVEPSGPATVHALPDPEPEPVPLAAAAPAALPVDALPDVPAADEFALPLEPTEPDAAAADVAPVVHPPVHADELPPLEETAPSVPWYKRDLSLGRGKKQSKQPKEPKQSKQAKKEGKKGKKEKPVAATQAAAPAEQRAKSRPFWKKELKLGRGSKKAKAPKPVPAAVAAVVVQEAKPKSAPFWKKELGRKKKAAPADTEAPVEAKRSKKSSVPFWKKGVKLPTLTLPQRASRGNAMPKQLVGLKVGSSQLAAARVSNNGNAELLQVARETIDRGIVVGGELRDPEALAEVLKDFFSRNKLPKKAVRLGVANNRIGVRTLDIVGIEDPKQLSNAIRFRAQEALPIPIEEAVLDYHVLEESVNEEGQKVHKVLLIVAYRDLVDRYVQACRTAGIELVGIDLEAFALLRSLAAPVEEGQDATAALVAVAVGHDRSTFAVSDGRVCDFTRVLEWGGQNISVAIARTLDLTPSQADPIKHALSLDGGPAPADLSDEQVEATKAAVVREVQTFARELVSSLQFYQSQPGSLGIGEIVLTGGTAHMDGFAAELENVIGVSVRIGDPLARVKLSKKVREPGQLGSFAVAIGLGIED